MNTWKKVFMGVGILVELGVAYLMYDCHRLHKTLDGQDKVIIAMGGVIPKR